MERDYSPTKIISDYLSRNDFVTGVTWDDSDPENVVFVVGTTKLFQSNWEEWYQRVVAPREKEVME